MIASTSFFIKTNSISNNTASVTPNIGSAKNAAIGATGLQAELKSAEFLVDEVYLLRLIFV